MPSVQTPPATSAKRFDPLSDLRSRAATESYEAANVSNEWILLTNVRGPHEFRHAVADMVQAAQM